MKLIMSQTLGSKLACVQIVHFFFFLSYDLKAEGKKHWNSQKQSNKKVFFSSSYTMYTIFHEKKKHKSIVIFPKKEKK